eukprot:403368246
MGNNIDKDFNLEQEYREAGLPSLDPYSFENQFEKEIYMSINLVRHNPKRFIKHFEKVKEFKEYKGKKAKKLIKSLETIETTAPLTWDMQATDACRIANHEITQNRRDIKQGSVDIMRQIVLGNGKSYDGQGFLITSWKGTPHELVILNILLDYEVNDKTLILDYKTFKMGVSYYGHPERENVCQILYVFQLSNQLN